MGILFLLGACGAESNFWGLMVSETEANSYPALIQKAQSEYNNGNYLAAIDFTEEAMALNPDDSEPVVLNAFATLGLANLDPVDLSQKFVEIQIENEDTGVDKDTSDFLSDLQKVLNITESDLAKMGTQKTTEINGTTYVYYEPNSVEDSRANFPQLGYVRTVINKICGFIPESSKLSNDDGLIPLHQCDIQSLSLRNQTTVQFLWALSHLGETLYFNSLLLYAPPGQTTPSIKAIIDDVSSQSFATTADATTYLNSLSAISDVTSGVFGNATGGGSMLREVINHLQTASRAIGDIPSIPDQVKKSIDESLENINSIKDAEGSFAEDDSALRAELLKDSGDKLLKQLQTLEDNQAITPAQRDEACNNIFNILGLDTNQTLPPEISEETLCN